MTIEIKTELIYAAEFEDDAYLDVLSLGKEVFIQPTLYEKYTRYVTNLEDERDDALSAYEHAVDLMSLSIRKDPDSYGIGKLTETAIKSIINVDEKIMKLKKDLQYLNKLVKEAKGALNSIDRKGRSLDNATKMYVTGYWGELTAMPKKMQDDIDAYLDKKELSQGLEDNERLKRRSENGQKE